MFEIDPITVLVAAWLVGFGATVARLAARRRRRPRTWAIFGAVLGPAALALLELAPPGRCWSCDAPTEGWLTLCPWCGEDVREPVRDVPAEVVEEEVGRVHGQLTVIDGTAPREGGARTLASLAAVERSQRPRAAAAAADWRSVEPASSERRSDVRARPFAASGGSEPGSLVATADPVHRLKARLGGSTPSIGASGQALAAAHAPAPTPVVDASNLVLASAIYVTGSRGLQAGSRYGIALAGRDLRILGPVDVDPAAIATVHQLSGIDATGIQGRLIITAAEGRRDRLALVFMSLAGGSAEGVADLIVAAAGELGPGRR